MTSDTQPKRRKPKSASGQGGYYWRESKGLWEYRVTLAGERCSFYGKTQGECRKKLKEAQERIRKGKPPLPPRTTLEGFLLRWLEDVVRPGVRPSVYVRYEINCRVHIIPALGKKQLAKLSPEDLQHLYAQKQLPKAEGGDELAPRTVRQIHMVLHNALQGALNWGWVATNVADAVRAPRVSKPEYRTLSGDEGIRLLADLRDTHLESIVTLALTTGLREGELLGLRWRDVDLTAGRVWVRQQAQRIRKQGWYYPPPKSESSRREVILTLQGIQVLQRQRTRVNLMKSLAGDRWEDLDLVHPNALGRPIERQNLLRRWKRFLVTHGYEEMTIHELRHSTATLLHSLGVDLAVIQEILGHSSISVTSDIYRKRVSDLHAKAMETLGAHLTSPNRDTENPIGVPIGVPANTAPQRVIRGHKIGGLD